MLSQYEPIVKVVITYLRLLKVKVNNSTVNETLQNHPDWPGLLCISDSLNKWNIPNGAGKIDVTKIGELTSPFIAYTSNRESPWVVVAQADDTTVQVYEKNYYSPIAETKDSFLKRWSGVYLIAEPNEHSGEPDYKANKKKAFINTLIPVAAFGAIIILSLLFFLRALAAAGSAGVSHSTGIYIQYFILLAGVFITSLLLWYEMDKTNPLLQKVCTGIAKGNCNAILTGKQAKLFSWLSWSEVGFFYFTGGMLALLFADTNIVNTVAIIAWLNILALPYTVFSVYYQWQVARQWCVLCLAVQALLLFGAINVITNNYLIPIQVFPFSFTIKAALLYLLPVLIWYAAKPYILRLQEAKNTKRKYLRIKFNTEIFDTLLKKQKQITIPVENLGIDIGNFAATNTLIKVCSPTCEPCSKAHVKMEKLLEKCPDLKVKIIFTTPNDESHHAIKPARHLMAITAISTDEESIRKSLDDWYLPEKKDYEIFAAKYPLNSELLKQGNKIEAMNKWCKAMDINYTPTFFINGYQVPDAYNIRDLQYFLSE